jgi:ABC-type oligopeptide transport system substrate-binding subunit
MGSPAIRWLSNIEGATEYNSGQNDHITGITAQGSTLTITLIQPQGEFETILAMPYLCAVPTSLPPVQTEAPIPSAGPYYISEHILNQRIVALRNPNYQGSRPHRFDSLEYTVGPRRRSATASSPASPTTASTSPRRSSRSFGTSTGRIAQPRRVGSSSGFRTFRRSSTISR